MKKFFITLGLSILIWGFSTVIQSYLTFTKYIGTFSTGCQVTGYPIDGCMISGPYVPPTITILINIIFWFWVLHFTWKWFEKRNSKT